MKTRALILGLALVGGCQQNPDTDPAEAVPEGERFQVISTGERITLDDHLPDKGLTVVEFGAEW